MGVLKLFLIPMMKVERETNGTLKSMINLLYAEKDVREKVHRFLCVPHRF